MKATLRPGSPVTRTATSGPAPEMGRKEVRTMESVTAQSHPDVWETPEFEEIGVAAEVTMYVARLED